MDMTEGAVDPEDTTEDDGEPIIQMTQDQLAEILAAAFLLGEASEDDE